MNKYVKKALKAAGYILGLLLVVYLIVFIYVTANKKSIIKQITTEVGNRLNGDVAIKDVDLSFIRNFPEIAVVLKQVSIRDTMYKVHHHTFFEAEAVYVRVGFWKLIQKKSALTGLKVENGSAYFFTDTAGYTNKYLLDLKKDTGSSSGGSAKNELSDVDLDHLHFTLNDLKREKYHDFDIRQLKAGIKEKSSVLFIAVKNDIQIKSLAFNLPRGSFAENKSFEGRYNLRYDKNLKQLQFDSIDVKIGGHPFNMTGRFDLAPLNGRKPQLKFVVHTKNIDYAFAKSILTKSIVKALSIVSLNNKLDVSASLKGALQGADPLINVWWTTADNDITSPLIAFEKASLSGNYTNEVVQGLPRKDPNSKIEIYNFKGFWQGLPITSEKIVINDLFKPTLVCDLKSQFPLATLNDFLNSAAITLNSGDAFVDLQYKGPLQKNNSNNSFVNGVINIKNGLLTYNPRDIALKSVNGRVVFRNSDVLVENLQCKVLNNSIVMNGSAKNVLTMISSQINKVNLDWNIYSPSLNLASFTSLLGQRKKVVAKKGIGNKLEDAARKLDEVLERGSIHVSLKADKLYYKKFEAENANALISILQDSWVLQKVSLNHAGGQMNVTGSLKDKNINYHAARAHIDLHAVDVSKVFNAFDNFGQDGITAESLKGKLTSNIDLSLGLDDKGNVYPASIEGIVDFSLKNGALIDYEPVQKLQNFLFKNRDFANIQFAELKDRLEIRNQEVKINRMEIQSSVLSMFVEGIFSMKKTTDISLQIPLSNLKKRDKDFKPENEGADKKGGTSVFIRGTPGPDGNVKFKYDLFHKFRKDD